MIRLLADENMNDKLVAALFRAVPGLDLVRARDVGLGGAADPVVLAWAAAEDRILLTHDLKTMPGFAAARLACGEPMPGLFIVDDLAPFRRVIDDLTALDGASDHAEWSDQTVHIPL